VIYANSPLEYLAAFAITFLIGLLFGFCKNMAGDMA
jgi:hypothetical protein